MKVEFIALQRARVELMAILERRTRNRLDALAMAQAFLLDIEDQFVRFGSPPDDAKILRREPDGWWWLYIDGVWLGFVKDERRRTLFRTTTIFTLVEVVVLPPATRPLPA